MVLRHPQALVVEAAEVVLRLHVAARGVGPPQPQGRGVVSAIVGRQPVVPAIRPSSRRHHGGGHRKQRSGDHRDEDEPDLHVLTCSLEAGATEPVLLAWVAWADPGSLPAATPKGATSTSAFRMAWRPIRAARNSEFHRLLLKQSDTEATIQAHAALRCDRAQQP